MSARRFPDQAAIDAIKNRKNISVKMVLKELGCSSASGSNYKLLYRIARENKLDVSHWKGKAWSRGTFRPRLSALSYAESPKAKSHNLRVKLIREGLKLPKCEKCKRKHWLGLPISLELHHIDGNKRNNLIDNLQILCLNCHSQTPNFRSKNRIYEPVSKVGEN